MSESREQRNLKGSMKPGGVCDLSIVLNVDDLGLSAGAPTFSRLLRGERANASNCNCAASRVRSA